MIGARELRREDGRLLTGCGRYLADIARPGMAHAVVVRSPHAHARIRAIDTRAARSLPGVLDCITEADVRELARPIPIRINARPALEPHLQRPLAAEVVRYVGEPVAVVVAADAYLAEDAAEAVRVEYEPLPAAVDAVAVLEGRAPAGAVADRWTIAVGDVEAAFRGASLVVRERFRVHRHTGVPIETRGLLAEWDPGRDRLTVWGPTKVPYFNRRVLAAMLQIDEDRIRFIEPDVGGGFGVRGEFYPEDFLVPFLAMRCRRPVRWVEDRREHFLAANHSREQVWDVAGATDDDGHLVGFDVRLVTDMGAYIRTHGALLSENAAAQFPGPYRIPNYRCDAVCVLTNKTPVGTLRAPTVYGASFARERMLDRLAAALGMDPIEIRFRNLVTPAEMPYAVGTVNAGIPLVYPPSDYPALFRQSLELVEVDALRRAVSEHNARGGVVRLGFGLMAMVELSTVGPFESAKVEIGPTGRVHVYTGATSLGQGHETTLAQVCAEVLGVPLDAIEVHHGDTRDLPYGQGTYASRFGVAARAVHDAASEVREQLLRLGAGLLEADPADVVLAGGRLGVKGAPDHGYSLADLARAVAPLAPSQASATGRVAATELRATAYHRVHRPAVSFAVHAALVAVDTATGHVTPRKYCVVADVGCMVNPMIVEGQLVGGIVQGIGGSIYEELVYAPDGQILTTTLMDYLLPSACEVPEIAVFPQEDTHAGSAVTAVHGVGEAGTAGTAAALTAAVEDALRPWDVSLVELPLSPERLLAPLRARDATTR
jgi:aerobic carbon-monoxide dehydrogenase large subunit